MTENYSVDTLPIDFIEKAAFESFYIVHSDQILKEIPVHLLRYAVFYENRRCLEQLLETLQCIVPDSNSTHRLSLLMHEAFLAKTDIDLSGFSDLFEATAQRLIAEDEDVSRPFDLLGRWFSCNFRFVNTTQPDTVTTLMHDEGHLTVYVLMACSMFVLYPSASSYKSVWQPTSLQQVKSSSAVSEKEKLETDKSLSELKELQSQSSFHSLGENPLDCLEKAEACLLKEVQDFFSKKRQLLTGSNASRTATVSVKFQSALLEQMIQVEITQTMFSLGEGKKRCSLCNKHAELACNCACFECALLLYKPEATHCVHCKTEFSQQFSESVKATGKPCGNCGEVVWMYETLQCSCTCCLKCFDDIDKRTGIQCSLCKA